MVFCRPHIYTTTPASTANATAPIAIPTIGPVPSPDLCDEVAVAVDVVAAGDVEEVDATGVGVIVAPVAVVVRDKGPADSTGKGFSPGLNSSVAF